MPAVRFAVAGALFASLAVSQPQSPIRPVDNPTLPWWLVDAPFQDRDDSTTPELPAEAEIVIIGAGMTGASAAYHLAEAGLGDGVVLLEARGVSAGATGRNGGHVIEATQDFRSIAADVGDKVVGELLAFEDATVEALISFVRSNGVDCDLIRGPPELGPPTLEGGQGAFVMPSKADKSHRLSVVDYLREHQPEARVTKSLGVLDGTEAQETYQSPSYTGAVQTASGGSLWPAKIVFALVKFALEGGVNLQTHTTVDAVEDAGQGDRPIVVRTSRGTINTKQVLFASNAWTGGLLPELLPFITPTPGQVIATAPAKHGAWNFTNLIMEDADDSEYMIQRPDGRILLGTDLDHGDWNESGNWDDSASTLNPKASAFLHGYFAKNFPDLFPEGVEIEREWVGIEAYSRDRLPWVGPLPNKPGQFVSAAYTGHGMPTAFLCARAVADMLRGQTPSPFVQAFLPSARLGDGSFLV